MKLLLTLLLTSTLVGQEVVNWNPEMGHAYDNGHFWYNATSRSANVRVTLVDSGQYIVAQVIVVNLSDQKVDVLPSGFGLALFDLKKPPKVLDNVPPERVIGKINSGLGWSRFGAGMAAGMATRQETTTSNTSGNVDVYGDGGSANGTYSGTTTTNRQVPDEARRQQIWEQQRQREQAAYNEAQAVSESSLRASTLEPGQGIQGAAFFKRDRSCGSRSGCRMWLVVPVGETTFRFPVAFKRP